MMLKVAPARLRPGGLFHARETAMIATLALILCFVAALILLIPPPDFWWRGSAKRPSPRFSPSGWRGFRSLRPSTALRAVPLPIACGDREDWIGRAYPPCVRGTRGGGPCGAWWRCPDPPRDGE